MATPFEVRGANRNPRAETETRNGGGDPKTHARAQMAPVGRERGARGVHLHHHVWAKTITIIHVMSMRHEHSALRTGDTQGEKTNK